MRAHINRTELHCHVEGHGPPLVVLHGGPGFDHAYLRPGLSPLARDNHVVFVDLRGQGRSSRVPVETCTLEQMADDVAALCAELALERPAFVGHSAGGFVALQLALRHPALPSALILCHTAPTLVPIAGAAPPGPAERGGPKAAAASARLFGGDFSDEAVEEFNRLVLPLYAAPGREDLPAQIMATTRLNTDVAAYFFARPAPLYDVRPQLHEIACPTLVIAGRHDWICPPAAARAIADGVPGAQLVELDSGHFSFGETPEPFLAAVRAHLAGRASTAPPLAPQPPPDGRARTGLHRS